MELLMSLKCGEAVGYVIFDCVCLFLGAANLRASATTEVAEEITEAAKPVLSALEQHIVVIASEGSSKTDVAAAVFGIINTIYSGGCLGAVINTWLGSLSVGDKILYAATALTTIVAAVCTDGMAEIGIIGLELATAGWLISDSIKCTEACEYG
jgi:hypothetical protein|tara:strand:+ start:1552 stop:2013 length:462 start_codon:yes stop_codon:yes gene_type:complete